MSRIAITRLPAPSLSACELSFVDRRVIDVAVAIDQHAGYTETLRRLGYAIETLPALDDFPDSCFVEDVAVVLDEIAVLCNPGTPSRNGEVTEIRSALAEYRELLFLSPAAQLEGGDVMRVGRQLFVGQSRRTNAAGIEELSRIVAAHGYSVTGIPVHGCLHLKTACCALDDHNLLVNRSWVDTRPLGPLLLHEIALDEPFGANVLAVDQTVCMNRSHMKTAERVTQLGFAVQGVELNEFTKAEAGITCLGLLFSSNPPD